MSLTRDLTRLIRAKKAGGADIESAALIVLDTLACALAARNTEPARILARIAPPDGADLARRAFHLGGIAHILEMDDLHRDSVTHPGCVVIPAAWALAQELDLGGRAFLQAVLAGYEACCRVGMAVGKEHYRVWHNTSTCGPFGSAFAAAQLLDLDEDQTVWALGNAGTQSSGLWEFLASGAMSKHLHTARAAESGLLAALMAKEGFTGPERILEGEKGFFAGLCPDPSPEAVTAGPDRAWELTKTSIKPWPCCRHTHPTIDAALELHETLGGRQIAGVRVGTYRAALDVCDRPTPEDPYSAKFSLQHCVAAALTDGAVVQSSFDAEARERLAGERAKVELSVAREIDAAYPKAWGSQVDVETTSGERFTALRRAAKGDPENPVDAEGLAGKARTLLADAGYDKGWAEGLMSAILALAEDRPMREIDLFGRAGTEPAMRLAQSA